MSHIDGFVHQQGVALLGAMVLMLILSLLGATLLNLAGQEAISANAGREAAIAQQLADAAGELVVAWFHSPQAKSVPPALSFGQGETDAPRRSPGDSPWKTSPGVVEPTVARSIVPAVSGPYTR